MKNQYPCANTATTTLRFYCAKMNVTINTYITKMFDRRDDVLVYCRSKPCRLHTAQAARDSASSDSSRVDLPLKPWFHVKITLFYRILKCLVFYFNMEPCLK